MGKLLIHLELATSQLQRAELEVKRLQATLKPGGLASPHDGELKAALEITELESDIDRLRKEQRELRSQLATPVVKQAQFKLSAAICRNKAIIRDALEAAQVRAERPGVTITTALPPVLATLFCSEHIRNGRTNEPP